MSTGDTMATIADDLFRFEVPTPRGVVVVIAPSEMTQEEASVAADKIARIFRLMPVDPGDGMSTGERDAG